jgi:hypothetical protein
MAPGHVAARFIAPTLNAYRRQSRTRPCSGAILTSMETGIAFRPLAMLSSPFQARNACLHPLLGAKLARMGDGGEGDRCWGRIVPRGRRPCWERPVSPGPHQALPRRGGRLPTGEGAMPLTLVCVARRPEGPLSPPCQEKTHVLGRHTIKVPDSPACEPDLIQMSTLCSSAYSTACRWITWGNGSIFSKSSA